MASYRLSQTADEDLDRLYEYGVLTFGLEQADRYYDGLIQRFQELVEAPRLWQAVDHICAGYRRSVYGSHSIYYRIDGDAIEIMRILGHEDTKTLL